MSVFAGEQPTQTSWPGTHHAELVTSGSLCESVYQVAAIYTAIMGFLKWNMQELNVLEAPVLW